MIPDAINGLFGFSGSAMIWWNVRALLRDREIKGAHWAPTVLFFLWGIWNLFYYPHLGQWASFAGGCSISLANGAWLFLALRYWRRPCP